MEQAPAPPPPAPRFNPWHFLSGLSMAVLEAAWLTPWFRALGAKNALVTNGQMVLYFGGLIYLAFLFAKIGTEYNIVQNVRRGATVALFVIWYFAGNQIILAPLRDVLVLETNPVLGDIGVEITRLVPGEFTLALMSVYGLWRGIIMVQQGTGPFAVLRFFKVGIIMFFLFSWLTPSVGPNFTGLILYIVFITAALVGMASARVSILGVLRGGRRHAFDRRWLGGIFGATAVIVGVAATFGALVSGQFVEYARSLFALMITWILTLILAPIVFLLTFLPSTLNEILPEPTPTPGPVISDFEFQDLGGTNIIETIGDQTKILPPEWLPFIYGGAVLITIVLIIWLVSKLGLMRVHWERVEAPEYVIDRGDMLELMKERARQILGGAMDRFSRDQPLGQRQRVLAAAKVRRIYSNLIDLSADLEHPREPAQTPLEFQATLRPIFPATHTDIIEITNAYLKVRYGELPETQNEIERVETAWKKIRAEAEARKKLITARKRQEKEVKHPAV